MKSLRLKVIMLTLGTGLGVLVVIISISIFAINRNSSQLLKLNEEIIFRDYDKNIKNQVENVVSLIESVRKYQLANNLSEAQGKILARELVRDLRYDKVNYFWIDDFDGINILLPPSPGGEGKSRINLKDVKGKEMVRELIANGRLPEGGYTEYWFPRPGEKDASRKRGYTKSFDAYKWVIGTGNYVDDMEKVVAEQKAANARYIKALLIIVLAVVP